MRLVRWLVVLVAVVATLAIGAVADASSHSVSDTMYAATGPMLLVWLLVAVALRLLRPRSA